MRDWFSASALYNPFWIVMGTLMGLWGTGMSNWVGGVWVVIGCAIAALAWRASAHQAREGRLISENLGKLVNVTEPSPANILAAAGAKILTLDHAQTELTAKLGELQKELDETKSHQRRELSLNQRSVLKTTIEALQQRHGKEFLRIPVIYNFMVNDARDYAEQFAEVLSACGVSGVATSTDDVPREFQGLALWVKNGDSPPTNARFFVSALQQAGIHARFETLTGRRAPHIQDNHCEFIVGRRESISEIEARVTRLQADEAHIAAMHWRRLSS
jgi:hypothetical protein